MLKLKRLFKLTKKMLISFVQNVESVSGNLRIRPKTFCENTEDKQENIFCPLTDSKSYIFFRNKSDLVCHQSYFLLFLVYYDKIARHGCMWQPCKVPI